VLRHHLRRTSLKGDTAIIKSKLVVAQQPTTKRSNITVKQQFCWHTTYNITLNELHQYTELCLLSNKTFGELLHHFIVGDDETNLLASDDNRGVNVIGSVGWKKHEKKTDDCRTSISIYHMGSVAINTGPTVFVMKVKG
jgi:hypothetical protein